MRPPSAMSGKSFFQVRPHQLVDCSSVVSAKLA
jgi:hypothetical protein